MAVMQALTQPVADDEIAAELAASWAEDDELVARLATGPAAAGTTAARRPSALRPLERRRAGDPRDLVEAAERVRPVSLAREQVLPLVPALSPLLPDGLARGSSVVVGGAAGGATALALTLAAAPSAAGSWVATVGLPEVGLAAAAELGVALERLAVIDPPPPESWATVVAALVGAFDVLLLAAPPIGRAGEARRLAARARERGSVLVQLDRGERRTGGLDADLRLMVTDAHWLGLGAGHGHVQARRLVVEAVGRRRAARPRRADLWLLDGEVRAVEADGASVSAAAPVPAAVPAPAEVVVPAEVVAPAAYAGADVDQLVAARRARVRRAARQPLTAPVAADGTSGAAAAPWSDAG